MPRRRPIPPKVEQALREWIQEELRGSRAELVDVSEWVSLDPRAVPHTAIVTVQVGAGARRHFLIEKASERIVTAEVKAAVSSLLRPRCVHCAPQHTPVHAPS